MEREELISFLEKASEMEDLITKRVLDKLDATKKGFGRTNNTIEDINYHLDGVLVFIEDGSCGSCGDHDCTMLSLDELLMTNDEWIEYCKELKG